MSEKLRQIEDEEKPENNEFENVLPEKEAKVSRRNFLGKMVGGVAAVGASSVLGGEIPLGKKGIEYLKENSKQLNYEGERPEEAPGIGLYEKEALIFQYLMLPRNEQEFKKFEEFFEFVHGKEYRTRCMSQLTMYKDDPEAFDKKGWEFDKKYFRGQKMAKIGAKSASEEDLIKRYKTFKRLGMDDKTIEEDLREKTSHWKSWGDGLTIDMSGRDFTFSIPSVTARHEVDHATQESNHVCFGGKTTVKEAICIFDGVQLVLIDMAMRREKGLSQDKDNTGKPLYSNPIKFPSGTDYVPANLAKLAERFFDAPAQDQIPKTFVQLLANSASIAFFDNLIYGDPVRSRDIVKNWREEENRRLKQVSLLERDKELLLKDYVERLVVKDSRSSIKIGDTPDSLRKDLNEQIKKDPIGMHKFLVEMLQADDDPYYVLEREEGRANRYAREKDTTDTLRGVIVNKTKADEFWKEKKLIFDICPNDKK